ncbi:hypothetical protein JRY29_06820 [Salmonella enterica subsp. enterica serovar Kentucky]|nr:hypothetical protein JRY29_06820 [Salmonella enterica subsp. enterica serovar Kentucky]
MFDGFLSAKRLIIITGRFVFGANITFIVIYRMTTIVSDPTITQTESLWQTVRTVRRRQEAAVNPEPRYTILSGCLLSLML